MSMNLAPLNNQLNSAGSLLSKKPQDQTQRDKIETISSPILRQAPNTNPTIDFNNKCIKNLQASIQEFVCKNNRSLACEDCNHLSREKVIDFNEYMTLDGANQKLTNIIVDLARVFYSDEISQQINYAFTKQLDARTEGPWKDEDVHKVFADRKEDEALRTIVFANKFKNDLLKDCNRQAQQLPSFISPKHGNFDKNSIKENYNNSIKYGRCNKG